jgi:hypothetical protein
MRLVNSGTELGFRRAATLRANMINLAGAVASLHSNRANLHDTVYSVVRFKSQTLHFEGAALVGVTTPVTLSGGSGRNDPASRFTERIQAVSTRWRLAPGVI